MAEWVFSVGEVNRYVQRALTMDRLLQNVRIRGEVSNCKTYASGHTYFSLKDDEGVLRCVWFKGQKGPGALRLEDGLRVVVRGSIGLYIRDGQYQLNAVDAEMDGIGAWYERYRLLEERLEREGLFDPSRKRPLPTHVRRLGIITSRSGAVFHDIMQVASRRQKNISMLLYPVQVQGEQAPAEIVEALAWFTLHGGVDVIILGRGGGSIEDLWGFNDERVVRAICSCPIPIISAVGHETDHTLSDRAADVRAATPSMAAELAVPDQRVRLASLSAVESAMQRAMARHLESWEGRLAHGERMLAACSPQARLNEAAQRCDHVQDRLFRSMETYLDSRNSPLLAWGAALRALDPRRVLNRGYAIVTDGEGHVVTGALPVGTTVQLDVRGARMRAMITQAEAKEETAHEEG